MVTLLVATCAIYNGNFTMYSKFIMEFFSEFWVQKDEKNLRMYILIFPWLYQRLPRDVCIMIWEKTIAQSL